MRDAVALNSEIRLSGHFPLQSNGIWSIRNGIQKNAGGESLGGGIGRRKGLKRLSITRQASTLKPL